MKLLLLLSTLVTSSLADLLIKREEYLKHTLMKDGLSGRQCDDCCDKGQQLKDGLKITFFGEKHDKFWPCANGLISFRGQVEAYTPEKFPIANQPVVAAYWGDVDLRRCRKDLQMRCSYFKVYYGEDAGFLNGKITRKYMTGLQTFKAKLAIVQTWDQVGYYDRQTNKENTFQIVIVSDGFDNTFAAFYYDKIEWTTGDDSGGVNGIATATGTPAQMGFDAGNRKDFFAFEDSRKPAVINLAGKEFIYAISDTKICPDGQELIDNVCIPRSCSPQKPFPILDIKGQKRQLDDGNDNANYIQPPVVAGGCAVHLVNMSKKVRHNTECYLKCEYDAQTKRFAQPKDLGTVEETNKGIVAKCVASEWVENAAKNCVEVGIEATVSNFDPVKKTFEIYESANEKAVTMQVSLKSKPYASGNVAVELRSSCEGGKALQSTTSANGEKNYFCKDGSGGAVSKPLASFEIGGQSFYVTTLLFTSSNWNQPQPVAIKGVDNPRKSPNGQGYENLKISLGISSAEGEKCPSVGCAIDSPYKNLPDISIDGILKDNENLAIKEVGDGPLITTEDPNGKEAKFFLRVVEKGNTQYVDKKIKCTSSNDKEGKLSGYSLGNVQEFLDSKEESKLGTKVDIPADGIITLTKDDITFYVKGQPDDIVDGPQKYQVTCALVDKNLGVILPLGLTNNDVNIPGVIVDTSMSSIDDKTIKLDQKKGGVSETTFDVKLATKPLKDVIIVVQAKKKSNKNAKDFLVITPDFQKITPSDWNVPKTFQVEAASLDVLGSIFGDDGDITEELSITVDGSGTKDTGLTILHGGAKPYYEHVYGYASCGADPLPAGTTTTTPATFEELDERELETKRRRTPLNCFSYDTAKITGKMGDKTPDQNELKFGVNIERDSTVQDAAKITGGVIAGIVATIIIIAIILAIVGALVAMAIKRKRAEEADRKAGVKEGADKAEAQISFRMDEMENAKDLDDLEGTTSRLKGERDRLKEENQKLSADVGEEPMFCANTEDNDALVEQIKGLKTENDRLREMQSTDNSKRRRKKKKADGFGQQQE